MSKRSASDPPQDRPAKQSGSNNYRVMDSPIPGREQTGPHEGCPHHTHGVATTSDPPRQHLSPAYTHVSPAQASQGHYFEYPWSLVQEPPLLKSTDPTFYQSRRLPSLRPTWGYQPTIPPLSIPHLLNPLLEDHRSSPLRPISTTVSPQWERVSLHIEGRRANSTEITPSKRSEKSTKAPEVLIQTPREPRQKKIAKERKSGPALERQHHDRQPRCLKNNQRQNVFVEFADVAAHTAKCDTCNNRNRDGMSRCTSCGWQCCRQCLCERGGNRSHQSFTSTHVPADERRSLPLLPNTPVPAPKPALSGSGPMSPLPTHAPARDGSGLESSAADRAAASTLVDIAFDDSPRRDTKAHLDQECAGPCSSDAAAASEIGGATQFRTHQGSNSSRGNWMSDSQMAGEEFENPRRNPSRRARPIDLAE